jgi:hypothetical protein
MTWAYDKRLTDRFLPEIKAILGRYLIEEPPAWEDQQHNTDLTVLGLGLLRVSVRVRSVQYLFRYGNEITFRTSRPSGARTELSKIIGGWGNYFFYGFGTDDARLVLWTLCDLEVFRLWYSERLYRGEHPGKKQHNGDNSSSFLAFRFDELPAEFIIARSSGGSFDPR